MKFMIQAAVLICLPYAITASCFASQAYTTTGGNPFCVYDFNEPDVKFLLSGEFYEDHDLCMNCTCSASGMSCCGFGIKAGYMYFGDECKPKMIDNCNYVVVKVDNENEEC